MSDVKIVGLLCNWCCYGGADTGLQECNILQTLEL